MLRFFLLKISYLFFGSAFSTHRVGTVTLPYRVTFHSYLPSRHVVALMVSTLRSLFPFRGPSLKSWSKPGYESRQLPTPPAVPRRGRRRGAHSARIITSASDTCHTSTHSPLKIWCGSSPTQGIELSRSPALALPYSTSSAGFSVVDSALSFGDHRSI